MNKIVTTSEVGSLLWSKKSLELVSDQGNDLTIRKYPAMTRIGEFFGHTDRILGLASSPDGTNVLSAGADHKLMFWKCF